jgi:hypothetical protein
MNPLLTPTKNPCVTCGRDNCESTHTIEQPFRAGDAVRVKLGPCAGEVWVVAVYDARRDIAWIAGWPCSMVTKATEALELDEACDDAEHARMVDAVSKMESDSGGKDPRRSALEHVQAMGGTP